MRDALHPGSLALRPATAQDRERVRRWLAQPHTASQWGDAASAEAKISLAMGSTAALCRMVECAGTPVGYGHAVAAGLWAGPPPDALPPGTWEVELLLAAGAGQGAHGSSLCPADRQPWGAPGSRGDRTGLAAEALALLTDEVFATTLAIACCALVPITNEAAVRDHERAHFRWRRIWSDPLLGPTWVMLRERPA